MPHSFRFHLVKTLFVLPLSHCKVLNISVLTLLLLHLPYQMLTFDLPRHPLPSKPWIPFSDILSFPKKLNYGSTHKSFRLFFSMVQNHKYTLQHKSPKLTVYITKLSNKYSRSRTRSTIGSFLLLTPLARMNTCFPFHSFDLYSFIPSNLRFQAEILGHILRHPSSPESVIMFNPSYSLRTVSSPFRRGAPRVHWPELSLADAFHRFTILNT